MNAFFWFIFLIVIAFSTCRHAELDSAAAVMKTLLRDIQMYLAFT